MDETNEKSSLLGRDLEFSTTNTATVSTTRVQCKVYKRRWYVLFVFTAEAFIYNLAWNTWGPVQEPSKVAYGWTDFNVLLITSWSAIGLLATSFPLTWLMDSKGLYFSCTRSGKQVRSKHIDPEFSLYLSRCSSDLTIQRGTEPIATLTLPKFSIPRVLLA